MDFKELEEKLRANPELAKKLFYIGKKYDLGKYRKVKGYNKKGKETNEQEKVLRG